MPIARPLLKYGRLKIGTSTVLKFVVDASKQLQYTEERSVSQRRCRVKILHCKLAHFAFESRRSLTRPLATQQ